MSGPHRKAVLSYNLNLFCPDFSPWRPTTAHKSHEDLFGQKIKPSETYYKREAGIAVDDIIKLSKRPMGRFVYSLSYCNSRFEGLASVY